MLNRGLTVLKSSSTEKKLDKKNKDKIVQTYFQEKTANLYIKKILNDPNKEFLTNRDLDALKESYDKAHDIRKFEIELYWKRTAYVWTLIASLITVTGVLLAAYYRLPPDSGGSNALLGLVASVAILGVLITIISSKIIRGGEYWQKNWEYHVSLLEPLFSGRIYST
ncbi:RipA family octameric membrane protein, partial [Klebsiella pneumoniae]